MPVGRWWFGVLGLWFGVAACPAPPVEPVEPAPAPPVEDAVSPVAADPEPPPPEPPATADPELVVCRAEASVLSCAGGRRATACEGLRIRAEGREPDRAGAEAAALDACAEAVAQQQADPQWRTEVESECAVTTCSAAGEVDRCRRLAARACRLCGTGSAFCTAVRDHDRRGRTAECAPPAAAWERLFGPLGPDDADPSAGDDPAARCRALEQEGSGDPLSAP